MFPLTAPRLEIHQQHYLDQMKNQLRDGRKKAPNNTVKIVFGARVFATNAPQPPAAKLGLTRSNHPRPSRRSPGCC